MSIKLLNIVFISMISISCSRAAWNSQERDEFIATCQYEGGTKKYCSCFLEQLMTTYPIYKDLEDLSFEDKVELAKNCIEG